MRLTSVNRSILVLLVLAAASAFDRPAVAATFVVDSLFDDTFSGDSNPGDGICDDSFPMTNDCTLRAAIEEANALPGPDQIDFSIAGVIAPDTGNLGALPDITDDLLINGTNAPGWNPLRPTVYLDGSAVEAAASAFAAGFRVQSGTLDVFGIGITGFPGAQIEFNNGAAGGRVDGCVIGLDENGDAAPHPKSLSGVGIRLSGNDAMIGRTGPSGGATGFGNVISGNRGSGIEIRGDANDVMGNIIGMTLDGLQARGNATSSGAGILLLSIAGATPDSNRIGGGDVGDALGNHIANNGSAEIEINGSQNIVDGNTLGYLPNSGVFFNNSTPAIQVAGDGHTIGGTLGNRIIDRFGVDVAAIRIGFMQGTTGLPATNVVVEGNEIGTDSSVGPGVGIEIGIDGSTGNILRANSVADAGIGIGISADGNEATDNRLGIDAGLGTASGPGNSTGIRINAGANQVTFNEIGNSSASGILISGAANQILGNDVGFAAGLGDVGNAESGIRLLAGSVDNLIQGNRILNNGGAGIELVNSAPIAGNTAFGNSIQGNAGIGLDFIEFEPGVGSAPGPTPNDPGDADEGANRRMNHPEFGEADPIAGTSPVEAVITFRVDSDPANQAYPIAVDFYRADRYGSRQGVQFLDTASFDTFGADATITLELPAGVSIEDHITALATDADGNTSEFAPARSLGAVLFRDGFET